MAQIPLWMKMKGFSDKTQYSVIDIGDGLLYFDTKEEAERYTKGFPEGSYQISQKSMAVFDSRTKKWKLERVV